MTELAKAARAAESVLRMTGLRKEFPGVVALDGVSIDVRPGEILGLVGENGAGKSTLIKILGGVYPAGSFTGDIFLAGERQRFSGAADAITAGVSIVHQELSLVPDMSVAENLCLGSEPRRFGLVDAVQMVAQARHQLDKVGANFDPEARVASLGISEQQLVEIARALGNDASLVVLDEPTAALSDAEVHRLFDILGDLRARGTSFIFVSHHLDEVFTLCDRIAVLRDGQLIDCVETKDTDQAHIVELMTGAELAHLDLAGKATDPAAQPSPSMAGKGDETLRPTVLQIEHLHLHTPRWRGRDPLRDISLHVRAGEIVALAGAMGSGRTALLSTLFGQGRGKIAGRINLDGELVELSGPADAIASGVALVPEDRKGRGLVLGMSVTHNLTLAALRDITGRFVDGVDEETRASETAARLCVSAPSMDAAVATLSGGNQQKVVIGKWLLTQPKLLLLDEPTRGVDVGAKAEIYRLIRGLVDDGLAVLLASSDLPEIVRLADRVVVLRDGRVAGELARPHVSERAIMQLAVGGTTSPMSSKGGKA